jgi:hypothetical protein
MKTWQRRVFGILAVGGGGTGVSISLQTLLTRTNPIEWLLLAGFIAIYAWGIWCGVRLLEGRPGAERANTIYWLIQVPYFMSPLAGYFLASGFNLTVFYQFAHANLSANAQLGSSVLYSLLQPDRPFIIGINLFALGACLYLNWISKGAPSNKSFKPKPLRGSA